MSEYTYMIQASRLNYCPITWYNLKGEQHLYTSLAKNWFYSVFILLIFFQPRHTIRPPDIRELMICSSETRTSKIIHLTHTLKQTIINYTPDPTITSTFPAFIITLLCIGNICVNGNRAADGAAAGDWETQGTRCVG